MMIDSISEPERLYTYVYVRGGRQCSATTYNALCSRQWPPIWPFGIGFTQETAALMQIAIVPMIQKHFA